MIRTVLYENPEFSDLDFNNLTFQYLKVHNFIQGVAVSFNNKLSFNSKESIDNCKKICQAADSTLAVVYKSEFDDKIVIDFFHKKI